MRRGCPRDGRTSREIVEQDSDGACAQPGPRRVDEETLNERSSVPAPALACSSFDVVIDPPAAQAAYALVVPRLLAIPQDRLALVRGDMQRAAAFVLGVSRFVTEPSARARFARLAGTDEYD